MSSGSGYSIRQRLIRRTMACMLLILGGIGIAIHLFARHEAEEVFSARLANAARVLSALVVEPLEGATLGSPVVIALPHELEQSDDAPTPYGHPYEYKIAFQVWSADGTLLAKSASAPDAPMATFEPGFSERRLGTAVWRVFALQSGKTWVLAAEKDEVREEMADEIGVSVLIPMLVGSILLLVAVRVVLFSNLAPLRELARSIAGREPESLAPVVMKNCPDELAPVLNALNDLLQRMQQAFERESRFIDAAAHELRTPIAAVQLHVQNALNANTDQERDHSLADAVVALRRTAQLATQLLTFSRVASGTDLSRHRPVSLKQVCREAIELQEPLLEQKGQTIGFELESQCDDVIEGDPYRLQQLVRNLIDNASEHGRADGDIAVSVRCRGDQVLLQVSNDGAAIPEEEWERVYTPYYRLPSSSGVGAGLGLSIVREIARQHGAQARISSKDDGQGCVATIAFAREAACIPGDSGQ